ncbi:MAG: TatD family hydrolase [Bacteroidia bacterium]|nr:TatD family hydrolase [Bacteroidia bacterium]
MFLTDTHTHLYLEEFDADRDEMIKRAIEAGIRKFVLPNIDHCSLERMTAMHVAYPEHCLMMFGLHPCSVKENWEEELEYIINYSEKYPMAGVGEIGLDFYWDLTYKNQQFTALRKQLSWALEKNLPVSLHTRNAIDETIEIVKEFPGLKGVFHCFTGTMEQANKILQMENFYFGIGGVLTFKNSGLAEVLKHIPLERIVLETDAPYLAPVPFRGKRNEPAYLNYILNALENIYFMSKTDIVNTLQSTTKTIFNI